MHKNVWLLEIHFHIRLACIPSPDKPNSGIQGGCRVTIGQIQQFLIFGERYVPRHMIDFYTHNVPHSVA